MKSTSLLCSWWQKFTQIASESEVKEYFKEGMKLTKKNIAILSKVLLDSDVYNEFIFYHSFRLYCIMYIF